MFRTGFAALFLLIVLSVWVIAEEQLPPFPQCTAQCPAQFGSGSCNAVCRVGQSASCRPIFESNVDWVDGDGFPCTTRVNGEYVDRLGFRCTRVMRNSCTPTCRCYLQ